MIFSLENQIKYIFYLIVSVFFPGVQASDLDCVSPRYSADIYKCSAISYAKANLNLDSSYKSLIKRLRRQYEREPNLFRETKNKVIASQETWRKIKYLDCEMEVMQIENKSEAFETTRNNCLARLSELRAMYLKTISPDWPPEQGNAASRK
ncbi:lysozyme inhibitor LprI family protein [Cupriavidus sp. 2TAF22]|uniref:lysozyme inhibitor LprI family protein n=1 Tax=unclassified Cupriavidus TaxID=2640874 RepID=UPI003F8E6F77